MSNKYIGFYERVAAALENKVDKVSGKALSDENFTAPLKSKLDGLPSSITPSDVSGFNSAVAARIANVIDAAPASLDTLNELASALNDHPLHHTVRSLSTSSASIRVYRSVTLALLGTTVAPVNGQSVNVTVIEFQ